MHAIHAITLRVLMKPDAVLVGSYYTTDDYMSTYLRIACSMYTNKRVSLCKNKLRTKFTSV